MRWLLCLTLAACGATASTCPLRTRLIVSTASEGRAEACASENVGLQAIPVPGRSADRALTTAVPTGMPGGVEGPFTSWYPNGKLRAHGIYRDLGSRSVADGLWAFWYPDGKRRSLGAYHRGEGVGCFALWDEHGNRVTGHPAGEELRVDSCAPPSDAFLADLEARGPRRSAVAPDLSVMIGVDSGLGGIGARSEDQVEPDPRLLAGVRVGARTNLGPWTLGSVAGFKMSDADYWAATASVALSRQLVRLTERIATEGAIELGVQYTRANARPLGWQSDAHLGFWSPLPALELATSVDVTRQLAAVVGVRVEGMPRRDVHRDVRYCGIGCDVPIPETWQVGGIVGELVAAIRVTMR